MPNVPATGVPLRTPVDGLNETPFGKGAGSWKVGAGNPVAVTVNVLLAPTVKVALLALVIAGTSCTVSVKFWAAPVATALAGVKVNRYVPPVPGKGVPLSTPVVLLKETPLGRAPVSANVDPGKPLAATVKLPGVPAVKVVVGGLVIAGASLTLIVKIWP